jgi:drug/metabolite transporter (DMT)-like permease
MSWQLILLLSLFLSSLSVLFEKRIHNIQESNPITFAIIFQFFSGFLIFLFGLFTNQLKFGSLIAIWPNLILMTLLYGFGNIFYFRGLKQTEASVFTIVANSSSIFTIIGATVFLKQYLSGRQLFGVFLIFTSILLVNQIKGKIKLTKGLIYALLGASTFGFAVTNDKYIIGDFSVYAYLSIAFILPSLLMMIVYSKELKHLPFFLKPDVISKFLPFCLFYASQSILYFTALKMTTNTSQFGGIDLLGGILTVIMSIFLLKEHQNLLIKIISAIISFFGLMLIG